MPVGTVASCLFLWLLDKRKKRVKALLAGRGAGGFLDRISLKVKDTHHMQHVNIVVLLIVIPNELPADFQRLPDCLGGFLSNCRLFVK